LVDAEGQVLGRLATQVAALLRGKYDPLFTPHTGSGNHVVVINAAKIRVTGNKMEDKVYARYSGYPGGLKRRTLAELMAKDPTEPIRHAIAGMLPHSPLGRDLLSHVHVYAGPEHQHQAQQPSPIRLGAVTIEGLQCP